MESNDGNYYLNYFNFLKNLKNHPDTGLSPLAEWHQVVQFFARTLDYLLIEWEVNVDKILDFTGCKVEDYPVINRHKQNVADIVVAEFRSRSNVNNAAAKVLEYLQKNNLICTL